MTFILNAHSRTVHRSDSSNKRCQLRRLNPENAMEFPSPEEALRYLSAAKLCPFCLHEYIKKPGRDE